MPQRPRAHEVETETRTAFEQRIPSAWVYRPTSPDYGLDGDVELFEEGRATGLRFAVQLKGTDDEGVGALSVRLRTATCLYYRSLDVPVLLVRYVAPSGQLFVQWFHALDTEWDSDDQETVTLRLDPADEWDASTPERLLRGLHAFRWVHQPSLSLPVAFRVVSDAPEFMGRPVAEWARLIRQAMARAPGVVAYPGGDSPPRTPTIELAEGSLSINLLDVVSVTIPTAPIYDDPDNREALPIDVMVAIALAFDKAGHVGLSARITAAYARDSVLVKEAGVAVALADSLARDHRVVDALELAEALKQRGDEFLMPSWYFDIAALRVADGLSGPEQIRYREYLEGRVRAAEEHDDDHQTAIAHYNLANYLRGKVRPAEAFHHYRTAAKLFPAYRDYGYWCSEVAGVLYEGHRYGAAVSFYRQAQELGTDWPVDGLLGDALLFAGRYADAQASYEEALASSDSGAPEWALKAWALQNLRTRTGVDVQIRRVHEADDLADIDASQSVGARVASLEAALSADLLCGLAWFNFGVDANKQGNGDGAFFCFLMAALCQRNDTEAWANALALAVDSAERQEFVALIAAAAYHANGDAMLEQMAVLAESQHPEFPRAEFLNAMEEILRASPPSPPSSEPPGELQERAAHERLSF
jgi:tetratricopeptide (TPR) repeat protein